MPEPRQIHRSSTRAMSFVMVVIGIAIIVRTIVAGGGVAATGILLGALFVVGGAGRLYLQFRGH
jgi:hypothetical protein